MRSLTWLRFPLASSGVDARLLELSRKFPRPSRILTLPLSHVCFLNANNNVSRFRPPGFRVPVVRRPPFPSPRSFSAPFPNFRQSCLLDPSSGFRGIIRSINVGRGRGPRAGVTALLSWRFYLLSSPLPRASVPRLHHLIKTNEEYNGVIQSAGPKGPRTVGGGGALFLSFSLGFPRFCR